MPRVSALPSGHQRAQQETPLLTRRSIFSNVLRDIGPQVRGESAGATGFARGLQEILAMFNPANAVIGDAVYSQEALDRIMNQLMEANGQSNAAPPASEEALSKLLRKTVDEEFSGSESKSECSICIEEMKEGEQAIFLPCKHWFHEACALLWLKEHNTCPVCRASVEKKGDGLPDRRRSNADGAGASRRDGRPQAPSRSSRLASGEPDQSRGFAGRFDGGADSPTSRETQSGTSALDDALRSMMSRPRDRGDARRERASVTGFSSDTSRLQRRTSHSPTSPRFSTSAQQASRTRQRSPSQSNRRGHGERENRRQSSSYGPWNWLRERFPGAGGSGGNSRSSRDDGHS